MLWEKTISFGGAEKYKNEEQLTRNFLLLCIIFITNLYAYDDQFSRYVDIVYKKYHVKPGDWCTQLLETTRSITGNSGENISYIQLKNAGVDDDYLDAIALEICLQDPHAYIATIWPTMDYSQEEMVYNILKKYVKVIYHKKFTFKNHAPLTFIKSIPEKVPHISKDFHCYFDPQKKEYPMMCFVISTPHYSQTVKAKRELRDLVHLDPYCMHINDTHQQCIDLAYMLLNRNSIHFLNHYTPKNFQTFQSLIPLYKNFIKEYRLSENDLCVDGSSVLSSYGIRDCALDFDFLCGVKRNFHNIYPLDHHNQAWEVLGLSPEEIIYNPKNFFYYEGLRFTSIQKIREMKIKQGRPKDILDVRLIDAL